MNTYRVTGMTCSHCVAAVTEEITAIDGVTNVTIDLVAGGISSVNVEGTATDSEVAAAIDEAGYAVA